METAARQALADLYARADAAVAAAGPRCELSGRCCDFPTSGHQLWSTALEVEYARDRAGGAVPHAPSGRCPWYVDGTCRHREGRPLGCRLYFCDPAWAEEMPAVYERFHAELRRLHADLGRDYAYVRFVDAVARAPATLPASATATTTAPPTPGDGPAA